MKASHHQRVESPRLTFINSSIQMAACRRCLSTRTLTSNPSTNPFLCAISLKVSEFSSFFLPPSLMCLTLVCRIICQTLQIRPSREDRINNHHHHHHWINIADIIINCDSNNCPVNPLTPPPPPKKKFSLNRKRILCRFRLEYGGCGV